MLFNVKQKILITLLEVPMQNSEIAKRVGITEQWCSKILEVLHTQGLVESEFKVPRRINRLTPKGVEIAKRLKEIESFSGK